MPKDLSSRVAAIVALGLTAALLTAGCVTRGKYDGVVAERDRLTEENQNLRRQTATVAGVAADLSMELRLRDREIEQMQREQEELADEIEAWAMLGAIKMQLLADGLHITLPHDVLGRFGAARVLLKRASAGTGVIAGGPVRAVLEAAGVRDVLTKNIGTSNPHNVVRATMTALGELRDPVDRLEELGRA